MEAMQDLQSYIDNDQVVSVRWLANTMGSSVEKARGLMAEYKKQHAGTPASYLVSGQKECGNAIGFRIVLEDRLEEEKKLFRTVSSVHIYSLQRAKVEKAKVALAVHAVDHGQAEDCLWNQHPNSEAFVTNKLGGIKLSGKGVTIKPPGQRAIVNDKPKAASAASSSGSGSGSTSGSSNKSSSGSSSSGSGGSGGSGGSVISKSSTTSAASFFGGTGKKTTSKPKAAQTKLGFGQGAAANTKQSASASASLDTASSAIAAPAQEKVVIGADDDEEEFDDGTGIKANKDNLKKREMAVGMPVGEGGLHQADVEVMEEGLAEGHAEGKENTPLDRDEDDEDGHKGTKKGTKRKGKEALGPVHGAMDDWKEDQAEHMAAQGGKRKKKKITEKLEMDEKGYMVKRMVEEWVTDDEADAPAPVMAKPKPKPKAASPKKKTAAGAKAPGQKSIMGFFGKK